ncbi:MAG: hypothetical protein HYS17_07905 [Micavibrio aeruginosavorus]|uniref:DUF2974 domain-containing protein n=1 Tax=Micavibrio aeruginosavorus TaxID=349221 RepID=A0A7T5R0U2_9BACT|nr:MAG: hypothetical protein HYS17_07905 [Micavibrio aeruginosavorus]
MSAASLSVFEVGSVRERFAIAGDVYENSPRKMLAGGWHRVMSSQDVPETQRGGFYGALYKRTLNGKDQYVIAFRGMDGLRDLDDVARLMLGGAPEQLKDAYKFAKEAMIQHNIDPADVEYVGHSMGGYLSKAVGLMLDSPKIYSFNGPGLFERDLKALPRQIMREFGENKADITESRVLERVLSVNSKWDPVSWLGKLTGRTVSIETEGRPHKLSSLERNFSRAAAGLSNVAPTPVASLVLPALNRGLTLAIPQV